MAQEDFRIVFSVDRTPEEVFAAVTDVRGWWSEGVDGRTDALGAEFTYRHGDLHRSTQRITELIPGARVVWEVVDAEVTFVRDRGEWKGTRVIFDIVPRAEGAELSFTHAGLVPAAECYAQCADAWGFYVGESLRNLITTGKGHPDPKEVARRGRPEGSAP